MKNLLNRLVGGRKKVTRTSRNFSKNSVITSQIAKMGRFGQQLVVMSK